MKTVFLIINYNDMKTSEHLIENVKDYQNIDLLLVLDNQSSDSSFSYLYKKYHNGKRVHVIQSEANKGYAYAINFGCSYILSLMNECNLIVSNSDIEIQSNDVIYELLKAKENSNAAMIAPLIRESDGYSKGMKTPTPVQDALMNMVYIHRFFAKKYLQYDDGFYKDRDLVAVDTVLGCFFMIDTNALRDVGFFDEHTFLYYEEYIIGKKLKEKEYKVVVDMNVEVFHNHSVSIDKNLNRLNKWKQLKKSQYYFQTIYNKANLIERFLLNTTRSINYVLFKIIYSIKK